MTKKLISMLLSIAMVLSVAVVGISGVYAAIDSDGHYVPSEGTATKRLYFVMPESWKNEKFGADSAGIFWWNGTDACVSNGESLQAAPWPGYKMQVYDADANIFYIDIPSDVPNILFNNYLNGGEREEDAETGKVTFEFGEEQFKAAMQTKDMSCQYYSAGDDDYYDNMLDGEFWAKAEAAFDGDDKTFLGNFKDNFFIDTDFELGISMTFDNMIFVIDPENYDVNERSGKVSYGGEYYFFYGKNEETGKYEYGGLPNYDMAKENGVVSVLDKSVFPNPTVQPTEPYTSVQPTNPNPSVQPTDPYPPVQPTEPYPSVQPTDPSQDIQPSIGENTISFDVRKSGWNNVKTVFCHVWAADGTGDWPYWQSKKEKCKYDSSTGIATYDLSKTGHNIKKSDGKLYCVIFSTDTGMQTYDVIMSGKCIGDTLYCTGNKFENPEDSEKFALEAVWTKNNDCGPKRRITSTGNVVGTALPEGVTDETLLAQYLIDYYDSPDKTDFTQNLLNTLAVSPKNVKTAAESILDSSDYLDKTTILPKIEKILAECSDPFNGMIYGDVNNDGMITIVDATIVQKHIVNMVHLDNVNQKLADVDVDGVITVKDATAVQKYIVNVDGYGKTGEKSAAA